MVVMDSEKKYLRHTKQWGEKGVVSIVVNSNDDALIVQILKSTSVDALVSRYI
jgi:hypothetical protein